MTISKSALEAKVRELIKKEDFTISDRDYETLTKATEGMDLQNELETAIAFISFGMFDKADFVCERNNRKKDLPVIVKMILEILRTHKGGQNSVIEVDSVILDYVAKGEIEFIFGHDFFASTERKLICAMIDKVAKG